MSQEPKNPLAQAKSVTSAKSARSAKVTARLVAGRVVARTLRDGAFASAALSSELDRAVQLEVRDRALATELVYGALRFRAFVDAELTRASSRGKTNLDPETHAHLLVAGYQLFGLDRVPPFAAVNEAVSLVRGARGDRVAAFANAILRRLTERAASMDPEARLEARLASAPEWLVAVLTTSLGKAGCRAFLADSSEAPPACLGVPHADLREAAMAKAKTIAPDATVVAGRVSPLAFTVAGGGSPSALAAAIGEGTFVQEEGSQVVALSVGARPGERILDACAGRGNKTALLALGVRPNGSCDAADLHPKKLERLSIELTARGASVGTTFAVDWSIGKGDAGSVEPYDAVLIDAPCSGTGTLRRRPDLWLRRTPESLAELSALQAKILSEASDLVRPGGRLVYAVCSVLTDESESVVDSFLATHPEYEKAPFAGAAARTAFGDKTEGRLLPGVHGTDGYFLASLKRRSSPA